MGIPLTFTVVFYLALLEPKLLTHGEWVMGTLTLIYVVISFFGLRAIKKQADIALSNTNALMSSERAWVIVDLGWPNGAEQGTLGTSVSFGVESWSVFVVITCRNQGRTPAWIVERRMGLLSTPDIPDMPPLDSAKILQTQRETLLVGGPEYSNTEIVETKKQIVDEEGRIVFGVVKYLDIYGKIRETTFGYRVSKYFRLHRLADHPEYNKHT